MMRVRWLTARRTSRYSSSVTSRPTWLSPEKSSSHMFPKRLTAELSRMLRWTQRRALRRLEQRVDKDLYSIAGLDHSCSLRSRSLKSAHPSAHHRWQVPSRLQLRPLATTLRCSPVVRLAVTTITNLPSLPNKCRKTYSDFIWTKQQALRTNLGSQWALRTKDSSFEWSTSQQPWPVSPKFFRIRWPSHKRYQVRLIYASLPTYVGTL